MGRSSTGGRDDAKCPSPVDLCGQMAFAVPTSSIAWSCNLRSCHRPDCLVGYCALLEARLWQLIEDPRLDPLSKVLLSGSTRSKTSLTAANEAAVAQQVSMPSCDTGRDGYLARLDFGNLGSMGDR